MVENSLFFLLYWFDVLSLLFWDFDDYVYCVGIFGIGFESNICIWFEFYLMGLFFIECILEFSGIGVVIIVVDVLIEIFKVEFFFIYYNSDLVLVVNFICYYGIILWEKVGIGYFIVSWMFRCVWEEYIVGVVCFLFKDVSVIFYWIGN